MSSAHWKPLPEGLPPAARALAEHLRTLLDDHGVSLRQLANDAEVHHSLTTLHRYFSGQTLPPTQLIGVLAERYGDADGRLRTLFERARSEEETPAPPHPAPEREPGREPGREPAPAPDTDLDTASDTDPAPEPRPEPSAGSAAARSSRRRAGLLIAVVLALLVGVVAGFVASGGSDPEAAERTEDPESPESSESSESEDDLLFNGDFATGRITPWWEHGDLSATWQDGEMRIDVPGGTEQPWHAMVGYSGLSMREGEHYVLTFTARASTVAPMGVTLLEEGPGDAPELETHTWQRSLGPAPRTFTFPLTADLTSNAMQVTVRFGGGNESFTAFLDDVSLARTEG